jgi:endonuclease III
MKEEFFDWNEVRVTIPAAIAETVNGVGLETVKATRLVKILQGIFEDRSEVDLEFLSEMAVPAIRNYLGGMEGVGDNTIDTVLTFSLGMHFFPLNKGALRFGERFGLIPSARRASDAQRLKEMIEAEVEQGKMTEFVVLIEHHTDTVCKSDKPLCSSCVLNRKCSFAKTRKAKPKSS